jgi:hypothetical protein
MMLPFRPFVIAEVVGLKGVPEQFMNAEAPISTLAPQVVLSFDVEEHWRIEAAVRLSFDSERKAYSYPGKKEEEPRMTRRREQRMNHG